MTDEEIIIFISIILLTGKIVYDWWKIKNLRYELKIKDEKIKGLNNTINNIREEFLKYDWKKSTNKQTYNQLNSLYENIFMEDK